MGFRSGAGNLVRIGSFDDAARYFETTRAIRGRDKDYNGVPLRSDRRHHDTRFLRKVTVSGQVQYRAMLYRTPVIVWLQDGSVLVDLSYNTQTTMEFAERFLRCLPGRLTAGRRYGHSLLYCDGKYYVGKYGEPFRLVREDGRGYVVDESTAAQMVVPYVNSQRGAAVRRELKPFKQYIDTLVGLDGKFLRVSFDDLEAMANGDDPMARELVRHHGTVRYTVIDLEGVYQRAVEAAYKAHGAYDLVPLPVGKIHPRMKRAMS